MSAPHPHGADAGPELVRGVLAIVLVGMALGIGYNVLQHRGNPTRAVAWLRQERKLTSLEEVAGIDTAASPGPTTAPAGAQPDPEEPRPVVSPGASGSDPSATAPATTTPSPTSRPAHPSLAPVQPGGAVARDPEPTPAPAPAVTGTNAATSPATRGSLPHIPDTRDPLEVQLTTVKKFYDAGAALVVDARSREEYAEKHIAGAANLPYDDTFKDPSLIQSFQSGGKPVIIYCGGGECELSKNLAYALIEAGQRKVLVFMGGLPEWEKAGYALATGATP